MYKCFCLYKAPVNWIVCRNVKTASEKRGHRRAYRIITSHEKAALRMFHYYFGFYFQLSPIKNKLRGFLFFYIHIGTYVFLMCQLLLLYLVLGKSKLYVKSDEVRIHCLNKVISFPPR